MPTTVRPVGAPLRAGHRGREGPAGALLVAEAGGRVSGVLGGELAYNQSFPKVPGILAGAPEAYEQALAQLKTIGVSQRMAELEGRGEKGRGTAPPTI